MTTLFAALIWHQRTQTMVSECRRDVQSCYSHNNYNQTSGDRMREKFADATIDCRSLTFAGASKQANQIRRHALEAAKEFRRHATIEVNCSDVVVTFTMAPD